MYCWSRATVGKQSMLMCLTSKTKMYRKFEFRKSQCPRTLRDVYTETWMELPRSQQHPNFITNQRSLPRHPPNSNPFQNWKRNRMDGWMDGWGGVGLTSFCLRSQVRARSSEAQNRRFDQRPEYQAPITVKQDKPLDGPAFAPRV